MLAALADMVSRAWTEDLLLDDKLSPPVVRRHSVPSKTGDSLPMYPRDGGVGQISVDW